jgi:hypothetical protein
MKDIETTDTVPETTDTTIPLELFEQLCTAVYAYRLGALSFPDLLAIFEERLGLPSVQAESRIPLE